MTNDNRIVSDLIVIYVVLRARFRDLRPYPIAVKATKRVGSLNHSSRWPKSESSDRLYVWLEACARKVGAVTIVPCREFLRALWEGRVSNLADQRIAFERLR